MSSEQDRIKQLAERVARRLGDEKTDAAAAEESAGGDLSDLRASLSEIQRRLAHIETHLARDAGREQKTSAAAPRQHQHAPPSRPTYLSGTYVPAVSHPSQEQFAGIGEAVSELVDFFEGEKTCTMEPGAKPCDHCGACSSRGF